MKYSCVCTIENHNDYKTTYDSTELKQRLIYALGSISESRAVYRSLHSTTYWKIQLPR